jgi:hypothetical protein
MSHLSHLFALQFLVWGVHRILISKFPDLSASLFCQSDTCVTHNRPVFTLTRLTTERESSGSWCIIVLKFIGMDEDWLYLLLRRRFTQSQPARVLVSLATIFCVCSPLPILPLKDNNSVALSPQANHTDWATATCRRNLVPNRSRTLVRNKTNSVAFSPQANYTDWGTATCWRNLVPTFADRVVSHGQRGESPTVVNLSFVDRSRNFSFK